MIINFYRHSFYSSFYIYIMIKQVIASLLLIFPLRVFAEPQILQLKPLGSPVRPEVFSVTAGTKMCAAGRYVYISNDTRIIRIVPDGKDVAETDLPSTAGQLEMCAGTGGVLYVSGIVEDRIVQYDDNLRVLAEHNAPRGMMCFHPSGFIIILEHGRMKMWKYSLTTRKTDPIPLPAYIADHVPRQMCLQKNVLWIRTDRKLIKTDLFGTVLAELAMPGNFSRALLCGVRKDNLMVLSENVLYEYNRLQFQPVGILPVVTQAAAAVWSKDILVAADTRKGHVLMFRITDHGNRK